MRVERGAVDRDLASKVQSALARHKVDKLQPFWTGYRNTARTLGLTIRTNGLALALWSALDRAGVVGQSSLPAVAADDEKSGRAHAVLDLLAHLKGERIADVAAALAFVEDLAKLERRAHLVQTREACAWLLWQKLVSAAFAKRDAPPEETDPESAVTDEVVS
ncbi:MAG: hypothetical protein KDE35_18800 [Geminicoccaceae bacterium]|nr:hypothetical protein [Geminicoccaceae bacterium]